MDREERKKVVQRKLDVLGETLNSWAKKNGLDHKIVSELLEGNLRGTRGVPLKTRCRLEEFFGNIFD
jgi:hypothetical protein